MPRLSFGWVLMLPNANIPSHLNPARESKLYASYVIHEPLGLKVDCKLYHTDCTFNKLMVSVYMVKDKITLRPDYVVILH